MRTFSSRREFLKHFGLAASALPFLGNLPSLGFENQQAAKQRLVIVFSPNGIVKKTFWPDEAGTTFSLKRTLEPFTPYQDRMLILKGISNRIVGDGCNHVRGMGCLLTGIELMPGNIEVHGGTSGWASGCSIDQEIKNHLQANPATRTRFGSLEFGVLIPDRADTFTRLVYTGPNQPVTPIDNPYQMFSKLYGQVKDRGNLHSIFDDLQDDLNKIRSTISSEDRHLLDEQAAFIRDLEQELQEDRTVDLGHPVPELELGIKEEYVNMPRLTRMNIDLIVNSLLADFARIATLQLTFSVSRLKMPWLGIAGDHHTLSHEPDNNEQAQEDLTKMNVWFAEQVALLVKKLDETPEPGSNGSMLDHTTVIWTNELGTGNTHSMDDIPFVIIGGNLGFKLGQSLQLKRVPHNRLLMSLAHGFGHQIERFGNPDYCGEGPLVLA